MTHKVRPRSNSDKPPWERHWCSHWWASDHCKTGLVRTLPDQTRKDLVSCLRKDISSAIDLQSIQRLAGLLWCNHISIHFLSDNICLYWFDSKENNIVLQIAAAVLVLQLKIMNECDVKLKLIWQTKRYFTFLHFRLIGPLI